jgi:hypothetical protein
VRIATLNVCFGWRSRLAPSAVRAAEYSRRLDELDLDVLNLQEVWSPRLLARIRGGLRHCRTSPGGGGSPARWRAASRR